MDMTPKKLLNSNKIALSAQLQSIVNNVFVFLNLVVKEQALLTFKDLQTRHWTST